MRKRNQPGQGNGIGEKLNPTYFRRATWQLAERMARVMRRDLTAGKAGRKK